MRAGWVRVRPKNILNVRLCRGIALLLVAAMLLGLAGAVSSIQADQASPGPDWLTRSAGGPQQAGVRTALYDGNARDFARPPAALAFANTAHTAAPAGFRIATGGNIWRYVQWIALMQSGDWVEADISSPSATLGVQFWGDTNDGWARVLVDGTEVWRGNTYGSDPNYPGGAFVKYLEISGLAERAHTLRVENLGVAGAGGGDDVTIFFFASGATLPGGSSANGCSFSGTWDTSYGEMVLQQSGDQVTGTYDYSGGRITGTVVGNVLTGRWSEDPTHEEPDDAGDIRFELAVDCASFQGGWNYGSAQTYSGGWTGTLTSGRDTTPVSTDCSFSGTWDTSYGEMTLRQTGNQVTGTYPYDNGRITGTVTGNVLTGRWSEAPTYEGPSDAGNIRFTLTRDCQKFEGVWAYGSEEPSSGWNGDRIGSGTGAGSGGDPTADIPSGTLRWVDFSEDRVGTWSDPGPNGTLDGHFQLDLNVPGSRTVTNIILTSADAQGGAAGGQVWDTIPNGYWILAVYRDARRLNTSDAELSDPASGRVTYQLYGNDSGYFVEGQHFLATVYFADGTEVAALAGIGVGGGVVRPTPAPTSPVIEPLATSTVLVADSRTVAPGGSVRIPISILRAENLSSLGFIVRFDPAVVELTNVLKGTRMASTTFTYNEEVPGLVRFGFAGTTGISGDGSVAALEFRAVGPQGSRTPVSLSDTLGTNSGGRSLSIGLEHGTLVIEEDRLPGDGNGDGRVTVLDALIALKMFVKAMPVDLVMDVNGDGQVTPEDARQILAQARPG